MKVAIYARYSSSSQNEQSINGQIDACKKYAKENEMQIVDIYLDKAKSASHAIEKRDGFLDMIDDSQYDKFETILIYSYNRFMRDRYQAAIYKRKLTNNGVDVISVTEKLPDDPSSIIVESMLDAFAEYYSAVLSINIRRGLRQNAEKCLVIGSVPMGYKSINKKYVIDESYSHIIELIFKRYIEGKKMVEICKYLNNIGYTTSEGSKFKVSTLNKILQNKRYAGFYIFKGKEVEDAIPAIISKEQFFEVEKKMKKNKKKSSASKAKGEQYLLTGKLFCGHCESSMRGLGGYGKLKKYYQYYVCKGKSKKSIRCHKKNVRKNYLEKHVIQACRDQLTEGNIKKIADEVMAIVEEKKENSKYNRLEKKSKKLKGQMDKLINTLKLGADNESFQKRIIEQYEMIESQESEIQKEMKKERKLQNTITYEQIEFFLNSLKNGDINDYKYREMLVEVFINKIYLYDDKLKIIFNTQHESVDVNLSLFNSNVGSYIDDFSSVHQIKIKKY